MKLSDLNPDQIKPIQIVEPKVTGGLAKADNSPPKLSGIDPRLIKLVESSSPEEMSSAEALLHGAEQGVTAGFFDEAQGGMEGLGTALGVKGLGGPVKDLSLQKPNLNWDDIVKAYTERRDSERTKAEKAQQDHTGMFLAGNVAGSLTLPGAGSIKGATALGAATGLGTSNADLTQGDLKGAAIDTAVGAGTGYLAGKAGEKLGEMLTPEATQARASARAVKALGEKPLPGNLPMGKAVLDEGVLPIMGGSKAINEAITGKMNDIENNIVQPTFNKLNEVIGQNAETTGKVVADKGKNIINVVNKAAQEAIDSVPESSVAQAGKEAIKNTAKYWSQKLEEAAGNPGKLNELRKLIDTEAKQAGAFGSNPDLRPKADFLAKLRDAVNKELRGIATDISSDAGDKLEQAMARQSALYPAKDAAEKLIEKDIVHPPGSIMDALKNPLTNPRAFGVGAATMLHNPYAKLGMAGVIGAEKLTKNPIGRLGNIASARLQNQMAKGLNTTVGKMVSPAVETLTSRGLSSSGVQSGIQSLYSVNDDKLKQVAEHFSQQKGTENIADALNNAIVAGDEDAKNKVLFAMEQRPDVRAQLRELLEMQKENESLLETETPNG